MSNSTIEGLYIHHTKVGMWLDGPMSNLTIHDNIIVDQIADGINFHTGVTNAVGVNNCGSFNFTPAGSEFALIDLGSNDGGGTTGPWLAPWELPNTSTCNDRPAVVPPPPPSPWVTP